MRRDRLPAGAPRARVLAAALLALTLSGCTHTLQIESDTSWEGVVNDGAVPIHGQGNVTYKLSGGFKCARLHKQLGQGFLRARIDKSADWTETTAPFGHIEVCH